jgi:DNA-binding MarR family transcriptional regulator
VSEPSAPALAAIRAWYRLDRAFAGARKHLRSAYGVTGEQVAILRIVAERESWPLSGLRDRLTMHPATLGQVLARLADRGLVGIGPDAMDGRRRQVAASAAGRALLEDIPAIGPVRLRSAAADPADLAILAEGFRTAVDLFGLTAWADDPATIDTKEKP